MPPLSSPTIITLTTDFGAGDHYVGTMKGVLLSRCPSACLVDITHEIPPFSIYAGAYAIDQAAPYFPAGTVHLAVVDPGVGTSRKPIVVQALGQLFVAPDNGLLSMVLARDSNARVTESSNEKFWLPAPSRTFHGRDIFAPVAAALAGGTARPEDMGPPLSTFVLLPDLAPTEAEHGKWEGRILTVDRFGNVITNFSARQFAQIETAAFELTIGTGKVSSFRGAFGDANAGECFAYVGSSGYIEVAINQENASRALHTGPGGRVLLSF